VALALAAQSFAHEGLHEAIAALDTRIAEAPEDVDLLLARGELNRRHRAWGDALADALLAQQLAPDDDDGLLLRARLHANLGWLDSALPLLQRYLARHADHLDALWLRGEVRAQLGDSFGAEQDWDAAIAAGPVPSPDQYLARATLVAARGPAFLDLALAGLDEGLLRLGGAASLQLRAIDLELECGEPDAALSRVDTLARSSPRQEHWLARRGDILSSSGRKTEARAAYQKAALAIAALAARHRQTRAVMDLAEHVASRLAELEA
jgi:predicted negative regulator of RcsB-dependent stress response